MGLRPESSIRLLDVSESRMIMQPRVASGRDKVCFHPEAEAYTGIDASPTHVWAGQATFWGRSGAAWDVLGAESFDMPDGSSSVQDSYGL